MRRVILALALSLFGTSVPAHAAETITYRYDARGRLVKVERVGPVNTTTTYGHDKANNRTTKTVSSP